MRPRLDVTLTPFLTVRCVQHAAALAALAVATTMGALLTGATLPVSTGADGTPPVRLLIVWCAVLATCVLAATGATQPHLELTACRRLPAWRAIWTGAVCAVPVVLLCVMAAAGAYDDWALVLRNCLGLTGMGLLAVTLLPRTGYLVPWLYAFAAQVLGFEPRPGRAPDVAAWAWLVEPPERLLSWVVALSLLVVGTLADSARPRASR